MIDVIVVLSRIEIIIFLIYTERGLNSKVFAHDPGTDIPLLPKLLMLNYLCFYGHEPTVK